MSVRIGGPRRILSKNETVFSANEKQETYLLANVKNLEFQILKFDIIIS